MWDKLAEMLPGFPKRSDWQDSGGLGILRTNQALWSYLTWNNSPIGNKADSLRRGSPPRPKPKGRLLSKRQCMSLMRVKLNYPTLREWFPVQRIRSQRPCMTKTYHQPYDCYLATISAGILMETHCVCLTWSLHMKNPSCIGWMNHIIKCSRRYLRRCHRVGESFIFGPRCGRTWTNMIEYINSTTDIISLSSKSTQKSSIHGLFIFCFAHHQLFYRRLSR